VTNKPINWAGFYVLDQTTESLATDPSTGQRKDALILGPFQGKVACTNIAFGRGVCGKAAAESRTLLVKDVHEFPGHIACDSASNSEIVVPLVLNGVRKRNEYYEEGNKTRKKKNNVLTSNCSLS